MSAPSQVSAKGSGAKRKAFWISVALLWAACAYLLALPLLWPRGPYWGRYQLAHLVFGLPLGVIALAVSTFAALPARRRRNAAIGAAVALSASAISFLALDVVYTLVFLGAWRPNYWLDRAHIPRRYSLPDNELGFVRKPGVSWRGELEGREVFYRTDENGFRNPPGVRSAEIVFIGDSFTEAAQVPEEETFVQRVAAGSGLRAVNLGRGAYGPQQELIVLRRYGLAYNPRVVVWQFFGGNDLSDAQEFARWRGNPHRAGAPLAQRYFNNSLIKLLLRRTFDVPYRGAAPARLRHPGGLEQRVFLRYRRGPALVPDGLAETERAIEAGYRLCRSRGIRLLVILVPTTLHALEPYITFDRAADRELFLAVPMAGSRTAFSGKLAEICGRLGCGFTDTFPALRRAAADGPQRLYIENDEHLDVRGHDAVAGAILEWLRANQNSTSR